MYCAAPVLARAARAVPAAPHMLYRFTCSAPQECIKANLPCYNGTAYYDSGQHLGNKEAYWARHVGHRSTLDN